MLCYLGKLNIHCGMWNTCLLLMIGDGDHPLLAQFYETLDIAVLGEALLFSPGSH